MPYTFWSTLVRTINIALPGNCWCHSCRHTNEFFISFHYQAPYPAHHCQEVKAALHGWKRQIENLTTENCKHNALPCKVAQTRSFTLSTARLVWCFTDINLVKRKRDNSWYHIALHSVDIFWSSDLLRVRNEALSECFGVFLLFLVQPKAEFSNQIPHF